MKPSEAIEKTMLAVEATFSRSDGWTVELWDALACVGVGQAGHFEEACSAALEDFFSLGHSLVEVA